MNRPTNYSIDVTTIPLSNGMIEQQTNIMGEIRRTIYETQDEGLKQALKQLGWLPPEEVEQLKDTIESLNEQLCYAQDQYWAALYP